MERSVDTTPSSWPAATPDNGNHPPRAPTARRHGRHLTADTDRPPTSTATRRQHRRHDGNTDPRSNETRPLPDNGNHTPGTPTARRQHRRTAAYIDRPPTRRPLTADTDVTTGGPATRRPHRAPPRRDQRPKTPDNHVRPTTTPAGHREERARYGLTGGPPCMPTTVGISGPRPAIRQVRRARRPSAADTRPSTWSDPNRTACSAGGRWRRQPGGWIRFRRSPAHTRGELFR